MENCLIKAAEKVSKIDIFLFYYFGIKRIFKKNIRKDKNFLIVKIPLLEKMQEKIKRKYYEKLCYYLHQQEVKNICIEQIDDPLFLSYMRNEFYIFNGVSVFYEAFPKIISVFAEKKGFPLQECEIVFISNYPEEIKQFIKSCIHLVKGFSVYTKRAENFNLFVEEMRESYGIFIGRKGDEEKPKKYHKIYVNCEVTNIFDENFFHSVSLIDIYKVYQGGYKDVIFSYKTKWEALLKEEKIIKNLKFTEFYQKMLQNKEKLNEKVKKNQYKIVNIIK